MISLWFLPERKMVWLPSLTRRRTHGCFLKWWYPQIIHFNRVFHYKPSILGYPYFRKHPHILWRFMVTSILRPFWFDVFVKKSWPLPIPVKQQQLGWRGHRGPESQRHVDGKPFQELLMLKISQGSWKFLNIFSMFGFEFILIMIYYVVLLWK